MFRILRHSTMPNFTETLPAEELEIVRYFLGDVTDEELDRIGEKTVVDLEYSEFAEGDGFRANGRIPSGGTDRC